MSDQPSSVAAYEACVNEFKAEVDSPCGISTICGYRRRVVHHFGHAASLHCHR
jgi:hypothetical protein